MAFKSFLILSRPRSGRVEGRSAPIQRFPISSQTLRVRQVSDNIALILRSVASRRMRSQLRHHFSAEVPPIGRNDGPGAVASVHAVEDAPVPSFVIPNELRFAYSLAVRWSR